MRSMTPAFSLIFMYFVLWILLLILCSCQFQSYYRYSDSLNPDVWFDPSEVIIIALLFCAYTFLIELPRCFNCVAEFTLLVKGIFYIKDLLGLDLFLSHVWRAHRAVKKRVILSIKDIT